MNIGFLQFGGRGDMLMATAVLAEVRKRHPNDHITWMCLDCYRDVIDGHPMIDSYIAWPMFPGIPRTQQELQCWDDMKTYADRMFDELYIPQHYPDHWRAGDNSGVHLIDQMFRHAGFDPVYPRRLTMAPLDVQDTPVWTDVAINTTGVCQGSLWTDDQWTEFKRLCADRTWRVVDGDTAGLKWRDWALTINAAYAYVGLDSGGSWLAAATRTPQVVMRSSTNDNPKWLTGFTEARVRDADEFVELIDPTPAEVINAIADWIP